LIGRKEISYLQRVGGAENR